MLGGNDSARELLVWPRCEAHIEYRQLWIGIQIPAGLGKDIAMNRRQFVKNKARLGEAIYRYPRMT